MKGDCINGTVLNGCRLPFFYSFLLDKPAGYKVYCEPETKHYKKINKSVLITIKFCLEDINDKKIDFSGDIDFHITIDQSLNNSIQTSYQKFKANSYCVGQKHYSGTKNINGETIFNKK